MQDDGYIGPHIDFKNRINQDDCECSWSLNETHGDHVAGTIMGAGNLDPKTKGMAYGADLLVYDYEYSTYNMSSIQNHYENDGLVITSTSYSDGCNDGYSNLASQLDEQVRIFPSLIHVFSAGNSGTSDCGYGPTGWGNITGGHKSGKNLMTVGNLTTYDIIDGSSSRGPAEDGRIKPDICGVGSSVYSTAPENTYSTKTGTSMSCPGVAGTLGQLYEAYRDMNGGETPNSGLIKATVLNTGEDLGNPGPDFIYGWGRINARRAYNILEQNNYINDSISQGENESFFINVPNGTKEVRIMLYWTDYEGSPSAGIALVNDLNLLVKDPNTTTFEPWVLDESPNLASLSADAVQGVDDLNNMEQVTILDPEVGSYELNIDGFAIPEGPQEYFIVYEFVQDEIVVTYPNGGEGFESGPNYVVRWDASPSNEDFTLDYTLDDGATWTNIATVDANLRHHSWYTPSPVASGLARLRVTRGAVSDMSDTTFTVMDSPLNLEVEWACPDSLKLTWDNLTDATGYQASMLGNKYMDSMGTNSINSFVYQIPSTDTAWLAVRGLGANNARTERTIAIQKLPGQFGCVWSDPIADLSTMCDSSALDACIDVSNESANVDGSSTYLWYFPGGTPATSTDENPTVCYSTIGYHDAALVVTNGVGSDSIYMTDYIYVRPFQELTYYESFEQYSNFPTTDNWDVLNNSGAGFTVTTLAALTGNKSARLYNYNQDAGQVDQLISGPIDLSVIDTALNEIVTLSFRYSYRKRDASNNEWLRVKVKSACDGAWVTRKTIQGVFLSDEISSGVWVPQSDSDWVTVHVTNITDIFFTSNFQFMFHFTGDDGNNIYIDDINIYKGSPSDDIVAEITEIENDGIFTLYPNPADEELNVSFTLSNNENVEFIITDLQGKQVMNASVNGVMGKNLAVLDTQKLVEGAYFLHVVGDDYQITEKFIIVD
jgi:PKD repeat protein